MPTRWMSNQGDSAKRQRRVLLVVVAAGAVAVCTVGVAVVAGAVAGAKPAEPAASDRARVQSDGWIAYSTAPANDQRSRSGGSVDLPYLKGSDVYLARAGKEPKLVAGRGGGTTWNVCPAFSPDGTMLAFGTTSPKLRAIRIVGVTRAGVVGAPSITLAVKGRGPAPCPQWSANGSRVAYVDGGKVVVRRLDGSLGRPRADDPTVRDFRRSDSTLVSPTGRRVARLDACSVTVTQPDGSDPHDLALYGCPYALAGWSPDGRLLLVMYDISGFHFTMYAVPVDSPGEGEAVAVGVRVNHPRSWPRHGDVSWQPSESPARKGRQ